MAHKRERPSDDVVLQVELEEAVERYCGLTKDASKRYVEATMRFHDRYMESIKNKTGEGIPADLETIVCVGITGAIPLSNEWRVRTYNGNTNVETHLYTYTKVKPTIFSRQMFPKTIRNMFPVFLAVGQSSQFLNPKQIVVAHNFAYVKLIGPGDDSFREPLAVLSADPNEFVPVQCNQAGKIKITAVKVFGSQTRSTQTSEKRYVDIIVEGMPVTFEHYTKNYDLQDLKSDCVYGLSGHGPVTSTRDEGKKVMYGKGYSKFWTIEELEEIFGKEKVLEEMNKVDMKVDHIEEVEDEFGM